MYVVVNVDDVGMHPAVGRAVEILKDKGVVTSASLLPTGPDVEAAVELTGVGLGVHLDILRGRPVSHWQEVNSIVDENGTFLGSPVALFRLYAMGKVDHNQVEKEWRAQIERILDLGVKPTHLTSHKHVHGWPSLARMAGRLAREYGIAWVRKPTECSEISRLDKGGLQAKFLSVCSLFDRGTEGVLWPEMIWGVADCGPDLQPSGFSAYMKRYGLAEEEDAVVEICCNPGVTIAGDPPIEKMYDPTNISAIWQAEFQSLAEGDWLETFRDLGLQLTDFGQLP